MLLLSGIFPIMLLVIQLAFAVLDPRHELDWLTILYMLRYGGRHGTTFV